MKKSLLTIAALACAAAAPARPLHQFEEVALSPDGTHVATVEGDQTPSGEVDISGVTIRDARSGASTSVRLPCGNVPQCTPSSLTWSPDGRRLAFILRQPHSHDHSIFTVGPEGGAPTRVAAFHGTLVGLRYSPDGQLAVLATPGAEKEVGAVEAGAPVAGVLGADVHEQRIARVGTDGTLYFASPADLFVYEYDFLPNGAGFVGTAAHGDGDNNWWVAKLYRFDSANAATVIHAPDNPRQQIADPRVSPDGESVSFIGGLMSDFGSTGGDAFIVPATGGAARNITPNLPASVTALAWSCDGQTLLSSELAGDQRRLRRIAAGNGDGTILASGQETWQGTDEPLSSPCGTDQTAVVRTSFTHPPEVAVGPIGQWRDVTHANEGLSAPAEVRSITWQNEGHTVQGWLLLPKARQGGGTLPLLTEIHGGPAAAYEPRFLGNGVARDLLDAGYALFLPNPRGSFGQGEAFTQANVRDFGYGDLRDILKGIDAAEKVAPIDDHRLGVMGWSYGGFMTMWTVTQTNRFAAAVAGAGIANWQSYYGQNGIDAWMIPYFGASVYDDPKIYARSAPITFIKQVRTPTLEVVGENDIECPAPQTQEFWHALNSLGVTTEGVIYPGEGHWMHDPAHVADFNKRVLAWFAKYLSAAPGRG